MWPSFVYMSKEECIKSLRQLELEAYSLLISTFRAQGPLTQEKRKVLRETGRILNITIDRHKTEIRRAVNDEKLNTISYNIHGPGLSSEDWCQEGRRVLPMLQRISPQTLHPIITDSFAGYSTIQQNYQEIGYSNFERKKLPVDGSETLLKKSEKIEFSETFTCDSDSVENQENDQISLNPDYQIKQRPLITKPNLHKQPIGNITQDQEKVTKIYPNKKLINKDQKLMIVSTTQTIPSNSILHKTLSLPIGKVTKLNLEKFKIVPSSSLPSSIHVTNVVGTEHTVTAKHKLITAKSGKKVIPLSQLQMLNQKLVSKGGIKVLPLSSKLFGKNITMTRITPGTLQNITSSIASQPSASTSSEAAPKYEEEKENNAVENAIYEKDESLNEKSEVFQILENFKGKNAKEKVTAEDNKDEDIGIEKKECEKFQTGKIKGQDFKREEPENEPCRNEEIEIKNKNMNMKLEENSSKKSYCNMEENKDTDFKAEIKGKRTFRTESEIEENLNDKAKKNDENDDLAALMEIDSSEFIEPELKDSLIVKKEF